MNRMGSSRRRRDSSNALREFVNTLDIDEGTDELTSPEALASWLERRDLLIEGAGVGQRELKRAVELRETFRRLLLANNGGARRFAGDPKPEPRCRGREPCRFASTPDGSRRWPIAGLGDGRGARRRWWRSPTRRWSRGTWPRLKACPADDCQWAFYDQLEEPLRNLVLDAGLRQPRQGARLPRAARGEARVLGRVSPARAAPRRRAGTPLAAQAEPPVERRTDGARLLPRVSPVAGSRAGVPAASGSGWPAAGSGSASPRSPPRRRSPRPRPSSRRRTRRRRRRGPQRPPARL